MSNYSVIDIDIQSLQLDLKNPRSNKSDSQRESLKFLIETLGDKIINLAKDIVEFGTNPTDIPIVIPSDGENNGQYIVLEGNRRIAAIKFILEPSLAKNGGKNSYVKTFQKLKKDFKENELDKIKCVLFSNRNDADHWIRLKHTGQNKGVGVVEWGGKEVARYNEGLGKPSLSLQALEFTKKYASFGEKTLNKLDGLAITNLQRLIYDPDIRDAIGISIENNELKTFLPKDEVLKGLKKLVSDLAHVNIKVGDIYTKKNRLDYLESFGKKDFPNKSRETLSPWSLSEYSKAVDKTVVKKKKKTAISTFRKRLLPRDCILRIEDIRNNKIYSELRRLDVEEFPNSVSLLLRVFLELSLDYFIEINEITFEGKESLATKLQVVLKFMKNNKIMSAEQMKPINITISARKESLFSIHTLNAFVHNRYFNPVPNELKTIWDNIQLFIEKIWEYEKS